jgi:integrase
VVAAVRAWSAPGGIRQGGCFAASPAAPLFGRQSLSAESVRLILKERAWEAGYRGGELDHITPHNLRAGCITTLAQAGVHDATS